MLTPETTPTPARTVSRIEAGGWMARCDLCPFRAIRSTEALARTVADDHAERHARGEVVARCGWCLRLSKAGGRRRVADGLRWLCARCCHEADAAKEASRGDW